MNPYKQAVESLKECVKDAMNKNVNASTQSEIWRHYQGMQAIAKMFPEQKTEYKFTLNEGGNINITSSPFHDPDSNISFQGAVAADTVPIDFGDTYSRDVITFS